MPHTLCFLKSRLVAAWTVPAVNISTRFVASPDDFRSPSSEETIRWYRCPADAFGNWADFALRCEGLTYEDTFERDDGSPFLGTGALTQGDLCSEAFNEYKQGLEALNPTKTNFSVLSHSIRSVLAALRPDVVRPDPPNETKLCLSLIDDWNRRTLLWTTSFTWEFFEWSTSA